MPTYPLPDVLLSLAIGLALAIGLFALVRLLAAGVDPESSLDLIVLLVQLPFAWLGAVAGVLWPLARPVALTIAAALVEGFERGDWSRHPEDD